MLKADHPLGSMDPEYLVRLARKRMPFGKYRDRRLIDLPDAYVAWFADQGFPQGELGEMMALIHELKVCGADHVLKPLR